MICLYDLIDISVELGQIGIDVSKYRGTTRYRYRTFKVSKYRLTVGWFIFNGGQFIHWILYADKKISSELYDR